MASFGSIMATAAFVLSLGGPARAVVVFSENFDDEAASFGSTLDFDGYSTFFQSVGSTDLIASGGFGIDCVGGAGGCVDLDGSFSGAPGAPGEPASLLDALFPGEVGDYTISFDLGGNQRGGADDTVTVAYFVGDAQDFGQDFTLAADDPFQTFSLNFSVAVAGQGNLQIGQFGAADNVGAILDNVVVERSSQAVVPLPAGASLLLAALASLALVASRRT